MPLISPYRILGRSAGRAAGVAALTGWNPSDKNANIILENSNLDAGLNTTGDSYYSLRSTVGHTTGKWCAILVPTCQALEEGGMGFSNGSQSIADGQWIGISANSIGYYVAGTVYYNGGAINTYAGYTTSDDVMIAIDIGAGKVWFGKNGTWNGDPGAGTGAVISTFTPGGTMSIMGTLKKFLSYWRYPNDFSTFGGYAIPTGFSIWE